MISKMIENIIIKYMNKSATLSDLEILSKWIKISDNKEVFKDFVQTHYAINYSLNDTDVNSSIKQLLEYINSEKKVYKLENRQKIYKYIAAASVLLVISLTVFFNKNEDTQFIEPIIVDRNISVGTDKAILTLEDGELLTLEKGTTTQTKNASSNGEEIIYNKSDNKNSKIAYNYLTIPRGGQYYIKLSDGTQVWLNSESQLKYPVSFIDGVTRQVELIYGEAYFDVSPSTEHNGANFKVFNNQQEVNVYGTEFNIKAYKDEINIYTTLVEGKVAVTFGGKEQKLKPNEQSKFNFETQVFSVKTVDVYNEISWKEGIFSFEEKSLKEIMKIISRWYDVDVIFNNKTIENEEFIGILSKDQNIEEILTIIKNFGIIKDYQIYDKKVILE
ncbi:MAG: DUF4974 domain-containing protein [Bacteroidetes bacterium]|nr:DUF4974 domain-containing protein [Bacteroidota bacterium]